MTKPYPAGAEIRRDIDLRVAAAVGGIVARTGLGYLTGVGLRPAGKPGSGALGGLVRPEGRVAETGVAQRFVEPFLPCQELTANLSPEILARGQAVLARNRQQFGGEPRRYEEAHELSAELFRDVDADNIPVRRHGRAPAHAGIDRTREVNPLVVAAIDQPVIGALYDGESQVQRVSH